MSGSVEERRLLGEIRRLRRLLAGAGRKSGPAIGRVRPEFRDSALNLVHYVALRRHDLRELQSQLSERGLSSIGRCEPSVDGTLAAVEDNLLRRCGLRAATAPPVTSGVTPGLGRLAEHTDRLLGAAPAGRGVRIMVTMPSEAATSTRLVRDLVDAGMNVMRINCAHDSPKVWETMIARLHEARDATGRECRILMDLAGPKLRTGLVAERPGVVKWQPRRDYRGQVTEPARIWLRPETAAVPVAEADASVPVPEDWLRQARKGCTVTLRDLRGKKRELTVVKLLPAGVLAESSETAYVGRGTELALHRPGGGGTVRRCEAGELFPEPEPVLLEPGDVLVLTKDRQPGTNAVRHRNGTVIRAARVPCSLPDVFGQVRRGERVILDDGHAWGAVIRTTADEIWTEIREVRGERFRLRADKGINFPDSRLTIDPLTPKDRTDLEFVARHADMAGLSFVQSPGDVRELHRALRALGGERIGVVLKIETRRAFERLPELLLAAMEGPAPGVMIARGDLAVECGYERLAEVQEEILWLSEAARLPVIWATQVLDSLTRDGIPSRAEVTDAAMGERAECVMLNKGAHVVEAVRFLDGVMRRMETHQRKKVPTFRRLRSWKLRDEPGG